MGSPLPNSPWRTLSSSIIKSVLSKMISKALYQKLVRCSTALFRSTPWYGRVQWNCATYCLQECRMCRRYLHVEVGRPVVEYTNTQQEKFCTGKGNVCVCPWIPKISMEITSHEHDWVRKHFMCSFVGENTLPNLLTENHSFL